MTRIGLDVGVTGGGAIIWAVFTGTNRYAGMLTGTYVGASGEASIARWSWRECVGRRIKSIGVRCSHCRFRDRSELNIAAGIGSLELHLAQ